MSGEVDDEDDSIPQDRDWTAYWRLLFRKVTAEDIKDFEKNYRGIYSVPVKYWLTQRQKHVLTRIAL